MAEVETTQAREDRFEQTLVIRGRPSFSERGSEASKGNQLGR